MLDGEIAQRQAEAVMAHMEQCEECAHYYRDMRAISSAAYQPDREVPSDFRSKWQRTLAGSRRARKQVRPSRMIPVLACGVACVVVLSTALINPQTFGLGGENLRSKSGELTPTVSPQESEKPAGAPIVFRDVVQPTRVPKPATQNGELWEETVWSSATPSQVVTGDIEPPEEAADEAGKEETAEHDAENTDLSEVFEITAQGPATLEAMRSFAENTDGLFVRVEDGLYLEGTQESIRLFLAAFACDGPSGTTRLHVICDDAD